jgi:hypothetical protein
MSPLSTVKENPQGNGRKGENGHIGELAIAKDWKGMHPHLK